MSTLQVARLPISSAGCGHIAIRSDGVELFVDFSDGVRLAGTLKFDYVTAFRFRHEMHCHGYAEGSYDCIVEVIGSNWLSELLQIEPKNIHLTVKDAKHFAVLFSNNGYLEVVAESVELQPLSIANTK